MFIAINRFKIIKEVFVLLERFGQIGRGPANPLTG
jgi:hypothetical protein